MSFIDRCREGRRTEGEDEGFTLIELLVVLLIIGILLAIAIPTFLSVTKGANSTAAQSNLQTALTGADTYYTNANQTFTGLLGSSTSASNLSQIDTGLQYVSGSNSSGTHVVSVWVSSNGSALVLAAYSPGTNDCWGILDIKSTQGTAILTETSTGTYYFVANKGAATSTSNCNASTFGATTTAPPSGSISSQKFPTG